MVARVVFFSLVLLVVGSAAGAVTVINNGLAPPNPANVVGPGPHGNETFHIQNVGCNATVEVPCVSPGTATEVLLLGYHYVAEVHETSVAELEEIGYARVLGHDQSTVRVSAFWHAGTVEMYDQSRVEYDGTGESWFRLFDDSLLISTGGFMQALDLMDRSSATLYGGIFEYVSFFTSGSVVSHNANFRFGLDVGATTDLSILGGLFDGGPVNATEASTVSLFGGSYQDLSVRARDTASVSLYGGDISNGSIEAHDSGRVTIHGHGFTVDGLPVGYGPLSPSGGLLAGTLQSGGVMSPIPFSLFGGGQIVLVPEPGTALLVGLGLAALSARPRRRG